MTWAGVTHFTPAEMACKCGECESDGMEMDLDFMLRLETLRRICAFPFIVTSGYRCPKHNLAVSNTGLNGPHTTGRAVDIHVYGERAFRVLNEANFAGMTGLGINQKGPYESRFIHLDNLRGPEHKRSWVWTY